jgi:hypothetical protein
MPPAASAATPHLALRIGGIHLNLNVPSLGGLLDLGTGGSNTPPSSSSTPTQPPTQTSTPAPPPSSSGGRSISATSAGPSLAPAQQPAGFGPPPTSAQPPIGHRRSPAPQPSATHGKGHGTIALATRLLPASGAVLLIALLAATALGVLGVARLGGRRGGHRS